MTDFETKSSGDRDHFDGGGQRDSDSGKPRFDLLRPLNVPYKDQILTRFAALMARGAEHYSSRNWEQFSSPDALEHAQGSFWRHAEQWSAGETDEDHAASILANVMFVEYIKGVLDGRWPALFQTETVLLAEFPVGTIFTEESSARQALRDMTHDAESDGLYDEGTDFVQTRPWPAVGELVNPGFGEPDRAGRYLDGKSDEWYVEGRSWGYRGRYSGRFFAFESWDSVERETNVWPWRRIS